MNEFEKLFTEKFDFLSKLSPEEKTNFLTTAAYRRIEAGTVVMSENSCCCDVIFVLSGELKAIKVSSSGREISLYTANAGETCVMTIACMLGSSASVSPISIIATQRSQLAVLPCDAFRYHFSNSPYIQQFISKNTLVKFYQLINLIDRLTFKSVTERIWEHMLLNTAKGKKPLYTTHAQLASSLGTSREVVTRRLHELENAGLIRIERGKLLLLRPDAQIEKLGGGSNAADGRD